MRKVYTCYCDYCVAVGKARQSLVKWLMRQGEQLSKAKLVAARKHPYKWDNCQGPYSEASQ